MIIDIVIPTYRGLNSLLEIINALKIQLLPEGHKLSIIIVEDGSGKELQQLVRSSVEKKVDKIIFHDTNKGRSQACNTGWKAGKGQYTIFIDADCIPISNTFILEHCNALKQSDISCGLTTSTAYHTHSFWPNYLDSIKEKRRTAFSKNSLTSCTTANIAFKKDVLQNTGGFDTTYTHYGFEDRDLLIRCRENGYKIALTENAIVDHNDNISLKEVSQKMLISGQYSAPLFRKKHPTYYRNMTYGRLDVKISPILSTIPLLLFPFLQKLLPISEEAINSTIIPFAIKSLLVKLYSGCYFMEGTKRED